VPGTIFGTIFSIFCTIFMQVADHPPAVVHRAVPAGTAATCTISDRDLYSMHGALSLYGSGFGLHTNESAAVFFSGDDYPRPGRSSRRSAPALRLMTDRRLVARFEDLDSRKTDRRTWH